MNYIRLGQVRFPSPTNININMMPYIIGDKNSIPKEYHNYYPLIKKCEIDPNEMGRIGYLSISESFVEKGKTHRREGIHTDRSSKHMRWGGTWGRGEIINGRIRGGIFMASTLENSCRVWDVSIGDPGHLGNCEHLKHLLKGEYVLKANELIWMTDACPHESLPFEEGKYRQWFRVVTSDVSAWFAKHSTSNYLGVLPTCQVVAESKF
jgi:hypothetical protein